MVLDRSRGKLTSKQADLPVTVGVLACSISTLLGLFGCAAEQDKYVFVVATSANPYWNVLKQGVNETGNRAGTPTIVVFQDKAKTEDPNWYQAILAQKPKMIVLCGLQPQEEVDLGAAAHQQEIKVSDVNFGTAGTDLAKKQNVEMAFSLVDDQSLVGKRAAEYLVTNKKRNDPKVLILTGPKASLFSSDRVRGFKDELKKSLPQAQVVGCVAADWDTKHAETATTNILAKHPDLDFVFAASDGMALGAANAIKASNKSTQVGIIGVDGIPAARDAIRTGLMSGTIVLLPYWVGKRAFEKSLDVTQGKTTDRMEHPSVLLLTKESLDATKDKDPNRQFLR